MRSLNVAAIAAIAALYALIRENSPAWSWPAYAGIGRRSGTVPTKIRASFLRSS